MAVKSILFSTDMVQAILDGRKTVTRRAVKVPPYYPHFYKLHDNADGALTGARDRLYAGFYKDEQIFYIDGEKHIDAVYYKAPCQPGDILYVRETWQYLYELDGNEQIVEGTGKYYYAATDVLPDGAYVDSRGITHETIPWRPSIHMPKKAARIWLRVRGVKAERLQDITEEQAKEEGFEDCVEYTVGHSAIYYFSEMWDYTVKKSNLDCYGWVANPWVWVIEFEQCDKPESEGTKHETII